MSKFTIEKLHTTPMGAERIMRNLDLQTEDVVNFCKQKVEQADRIERHGKNWYVYAGGARITINANSHTIITAHKIKAEDSERNN